MLDIENAIITLDAIGCQEEIAKQIIQQKGDYVLALKGNHSGLLEELLAWYHKCEREGLSDENFATDTTTDGDHGRIETRQCEKILINNDWLDKKYQWTGLHSLIKITSTREIKNTNEVRYYINSLPLNAPQVLAAIRSNWQVD